MYLIPSEEQTGSSRAASSCACFWPIVIPYLIQRQSCTEVVLCFSPHSIQAVWFWQHQPNGIPLCPSILYPPPMTLSRPLLPPIAVANDYWYSLLLLIALHLLITLYCKRETDLPKPFIILPFPSSPSTLFPALCCSEHLCAFLFTIWLALLSLHSLAWMYLEEAFKAHIPIA